MKAKFGRDGVARWSLAQLNCHFNKRAIVWVDKFAHNFSEEFFSSHHRHRTKSTRTAATQCCSCSRVQARTFWDLPTSKWNVFKYTKLGDYYSFQVLAGNFKILNFKRSPSFDLNKPEALIDGCIECDFSLRRQSSRRFLFEVKLKGLIQISTKNANKVVACVR